MLEFWILIFATGAMVVRAIMRLVTSRFPGGADLTQLSTFYYSVPLAVLAFWSINLRQMSLLNEIAANQELAILSLRYVFVAMLSIEAGRYLGRMVGEPDYRYVFEVTPAAVIRTGVLTSAVLALFPAGVLLFGVDAFLQGYAGESLSQEGDAGIALVYTGVAALGISLSFFMIMRLSLKRMPLKLLFVVSLAVILAIFSIRVKRLEVVSALLPLALIIFASRSNVGAIVSRVGLGAVLLAGLAIVSATRMSERLDMQTLVFYFLSEGIYASHSLPGIIHRIDIGMAWYEYGTRFVNAVLAFVPTFLWPNKINVVYGNDLIFEGISPLGATTLLTEIVLQGGVVAVGLFYAALGFFFERIGRFQDRWSEFVQSGRFPARFGVYLISVSILIPHFRDGVIPAFKLTLQGLVYFALLAAIHRAAVPNDAGRMPAPAQPGGPR